MGEKSFLIDTSKCIGCGACSLACKNINSLFPTEYNYKKKASLSSEDWIISIKSGTNTVKPVDISYITLLCNHCTEADCIRVCPTGAMKRKNGFVIVDAEKCIACGSCVDACVYNAVYLGKNSYEQKITAKKCDACISAFENVPLCVSVCPSGAIKFDYRLKLIKESNKKIRKLKKKYASAKTYGLSEFGGLNVLTIVRTEDELQTVKHKITQNNIERLQERSGLFKVFNFFLPSFKSGKKYLYKILKSIV